MVSFISNPQYQLTIGGTVLNELSTASIQRIENGFDTATILLNDYQSKNWPSPITENASVKLEVKDASEDTYTTLFEGIIRQAEPRVSAEGDVVILKCDGAGYGLAETFCAKEYGAQSESPTLDTIAEILTDATYGIVPKWVNKIRGTTTDSGYAYTTTNIDTVTGTINYIYFPFKPCNKCLDDLCDIITAIKAGAASTHWIVSPTADLRVKLITSSQTGWTKYYGDSQANATLIQGAHFENAKFQELGVEANYILYYGAFRRPSNGDSRTENSASAWGYTAGTTVSNEGTIKKVGLYSIKMQYVGGGNARMWYPSAHNESMNISTISTPDLIPTLNFYAYKNGSPVCSVLLATGADDTNGYYYLFTDELTNSGEWYNLSLPIGPYYTLSQTKQNFRWSTQGSYDWVDIDAVHFSGAQAPGEYLIIDGLNLGNVPITRIAKNSTNITANKLKAKLVTDDTGKDDTLNASDDSGVMAQLAYKELLRCQTTPLLATITLPMIKDLLPGQYLHIHAKQKSDRTFNIDKDMRVTQVTQIIDPSIGYKSQINLTDDLTNSHPRQAFTDVNKVMADMRPEFQDRQAAAIKAGHVNIKCAVFEKNYS